MGSAHRRWQLTDAFGQRWCIQTGARPSGIPSGPGAIEGLLSAAFSSWGPSSAPCRSALLSIYEAIEGPFALDDLRRDVSRHEGAEGERHARELLRSALTWAQSSGRLHITRETPPPVPEPHEAPIPPRPTPKEEPRVDDDLSLDVELFDAFGRPIPGHCELEVPRGSKALSLSFDAKGLVSHRTDEPSPCALRLFRAKSGLEREAPSLPPRLVPGARGLRAEDFGSTFPANARRTPYVFQLERRRLAVLELEHFFPEGALLMPGLAPSKLREKAPRVLGIAALTAAHELSRHHPLLIVGHHGSLSTERARGVAHLLGGERDAWVSLAMRLGTEPERSALRDWATRPLPEKGTSWTVDDWGAVFDLLRETLVRGRARPSAPLRHKLVVREPKDEQESIYPYKMAEITFGKGQGARSRELEEHNPHLCKGPGTWRDIVTGDAIVMPDTWPPEPLISRGFHVLPIAIDPPTTETAPPPSRLEAIGAGQRHLLHPFADSSQRRGEERHVEVFLADEAGAKTCTHDGPCDTSTCSAYDPVATELSYTSLATTLAGRIRWCTRHRPTNVPVHEITLDVFSASGERRLRVPYSSGAPMPDGGRAFDVEALDLGDEAYVQLHRGKLALELPTRVCVTHIASTSEGAIFHEREVRS